MHGCAALVPRGQTHCPVHRVPQRRTSTQRGYGYASGWHTRAALFRVRYPLCGMRPGGRPPVMSECYRHGDYTPATQVDHVVPHRGSTALFWDEEHNWQALCAACHARKTAAGL
jgi:5-methylcytosine-specific restriction protein A